jgi:hypothetical protein
MELERFVRILSIQPAAVGGGGDAVKVNAVDVTDANFNDTVPAAVGTGRNASFQRSGSGPDSISAYINQFTAALAGIVPLSGGGTTAFLRADGTWVVPSSGDSVLVNAVAVTDANLNDTTPAAAGTGRNVFFQRSGSGPDSVSAYLNQFTAALAGIVPLSGGGSTNFLRADGMWVVPTFAIAATSVTVTPPYGSREHLATITNAGVGAGSKPILYPGIYAQTDTNTPEDVDSHVESVAVGSFTLRMIAKGQESFGGPFKYQYLLG